MNEPIRRTEVAERDYQRLYNLNVMQDFTDWYVREMPDGSVRAYTGDTRLSVAECPACNSMTTSCTPHLACCDYCPGYTAHRAAPTTASAMAEESRALRPRSESGELLTTDDIGTDNYIYGGFPVYSPRSGVRVSQPNQPLSAVMPKGVVSKVVKKMRDAGVAAWRPRTIDGLSLGPYSGTVRNSAGSHTGIESFDVVEPKYNFDFHMIHDQEMSYRDVFKVWDSTPARSAQTSRSKLGLPQLDPPKFVGSHVDSAVSPKFDQPKLDL